MNSTITLNLRRLLAGDYDGMTDAPPLRSLESLESLARRIISGLQAGWHVPGRCIVAGLNYRLLPRRPPGTCGEAARAGVVAYDPTLPEEEQSVMCAHGAAHLVLDASHDAYNHSDVWVLTCLLLVPPAAARTTTPEELVELSRCPAWLALATRRLLLRWGSRGSLVSCK